MADNVVLNAGSGGDTIAADDDGTAKWQYTKTAYGADNTQTRVTATNGLPIQGDGTDLPITLDGEAVVLGAGSATVGNVGLVASTTGGTTLYKNIDVDETEDQVKGTAGQLYWLHVVNLAAATRFLKVYNATAASVTVGTTVPDLTFAIPTQGDTNGAGFTLSVATGIVFSTAITIAATTGVADNDSTAPGANEVIVNLGYR